jgi:hypothetical protein
MSLVSMGMELYFLLEFWMLCEELWPELEAMAKGIVAYLSIRDPFFVICWINSRIVILRVFVCVLSLLVLILSVLD